MIFGVEITGFTDFMAQNDALLRQISDPDKVLRMGVMNLYALISERIQQRGERTDGARIGGYAGYSKAYKKKRQQAGRQTDYIDLTFYGDLMDRGFIALATGPDSFSLGFVNRLEADKMDLLEQRFGTIIQPNEAEQNEAFNHILDSIRNVINRANNQT